MTDIHLRDETVTMLAAGHETTAAALGWSFYLLNRYPEFERRLHEEVDEVLDGRPAAMDDLPKLTFCKAILSEVLRVYPVAWMLSRRTIEEHEMRGITLPAGTNVLISPYTMHRDPRFWDAPDDFDPDRWLGEREKKITRKAYSPFGAGIRQCIGEGFAWTEATIALATIAGTWQPKFAPGFQATPRAGTTLHPGALPVTLHRRHRAR
jgi:cytochrome P450